MERLTQTRLSAGPLILLTLILLVTGPAGAPASPVDREVTFTPGQQIAAHRAIDRVYRQHRLAPGQTADPSAIAAGGERRHRIAIAQSIALERYWGTPITIEALARELRRIDSASLLPDRLKEIEAALGGDRRLMAETLARATLVERLSREFLAGDERAQRPRREEAEAIRAALLDGTLDAGDPHPRRSLLTDDLPAGTGSKGAGEVVETRGAFEVRAALPDGAEGREGAVYRVPKIEWDEWWTRSSARFAGAELEALDWSEVDLSSDPVAVAPNPPSCAVEDMWGRGRPDAIPEARRDHTAVWTGSEMIVWGGSATASGGGRLNTGGRYDPLIDMWTPTSTAGAPSAREYHSAVWTGSLMVIWGGDAGGDYPEVGGRYDPATDSWSPTSLVNAPSGRIFQAAVWTGTEMIIWGDNYSMTGGRYNPATDTWTPTSTLNAPSPRYGTTAVWTGAEMIIWDGSYRGDGGRYNPATDTWTPVSTVNAPYPRAYHSAVWTGTEMIVWGAFFSGYDPGGGRYNPATDTWTPTSRTNDPPNRFDHSMIWTGQRMLVWGGLDWSSQATTQQPRNDGALYDPGTDTWTALPQSGPPSARGRHSTVWTGSEMIVWGGTSTPTGGVYHQGGVWTPTRSVRSVPLAHSGPASAWTGSELIVWGGYGTQAGDRYDPVADMWTPMSTLGAPPARQRATAVWTGSQMIVWGGEGSGYAPVDSGGAYDPAQDAWYPVAPSGNHRMDHTAVWTGSEMLVWGGIGAWGLRGDGFRYNPASGFWDLIPAGGAAPAPRSSHTAVWTGTEMIVWGGAQQYPAVLNTGGRFDPATGQWSPTEQAGAPSARANHTAVWTGSEMIVWSPAGGRTGGRYDPVTDAWAPTSTTNAPAVWGNHPPIWTGSEMIVWGGLTNTCWGCPVTNHNTGARYDPAADLWTPTTMANAPEGRFEHVAAWTGSVMLVWGGSYFSGDVQGPRNDQQIPFYGDLNPEPQADLDQDGWNRCFDCDESSVAAWSQPGDVAGLQFLEDGMTLIWDAPVHPGGWPLRYDTLRADGPGAFGPLASCIESDDATDTQAVDAALPARGAAFLYRVRAENGCPAAAGSLRSCP